MSARGISIAASGRTPHLEGARVLVVGLGRSGLAALRLLAEKGAEVVAADARGEGELGSAVQEARSTGARVVAGGHPLALAREADLLILSPGVPTSTPVVEEAVRLAIPVWSEVELAFRFCRGRVLGVTGSNGKSTTTSMAGAILRAAGIPGGTGGNLGKPFSELLPEDGPDAVHAVELSSFQLETISAFHASVAVVVNLTPDHMDRYPSFEAYVGAKTRLLETQGPDEAAIVNADDPESARLLGAVRGRLYRFSTRTEVEAGGFVRNGRLVVRTEAGEAEILEAAALPVPGEHNLANALAAATAGRLAGCEPDAIGSGLRTFRALPHRLEYVASLDGVVFYNDSKATNLDSALRALRSFAPGRVHLILGGKDKGADWSALVPALKDHARRVLLVGAAAETIRKSLEGKVALVDCGTVRTAVRVGYDGASDGDVVLLAPGCASFDQYRNFEERGKDFRASVEALFPEGEHRA